MQFLILGILLEGPLALYDVHKRFTGGISLFYAASFGSIQRALRLLDGQGWAAPVDAPDARRRKKLYVISAAGRRAWQEWMLSPLTGSDSEQMMLARVYLLGSLPESERAATIAMIRSRISEDGAALSDLARHVDDAEVPNDLAAVVRYRRATLEFGIRSHALALEWLDELEKSA